MIEVDGIPAYRLNPTVIEDVKKIYHQVRNDDIHSADLAKIFNLKAPTSGNFYPRLRSLEWYGLLEGGKGRGFYTLTKLAKEIVDPDNEKQKNAACIDAVFNVRLWKELHNQFPTGLGQSIWYVIKKVTGLTADEAQKIEQEVREAYSQDIEFIKDFLEETHEQNDYSFDFRDKNIDSMSQHLVYKDPRNIGFGTITIEGIGSVTVKDEDSLIAAEAFLNIIRKKVSELKIEINLQNEQKNIPLPINIKQHENDDTSENENPSPDS